MSTRAERKKYARVWARWWWQRNNMCTDDNEDDLEFLKFAKCIRTWKFTESDQYKENVLSGKENYIVQIGKELCSKRL